MSSRQLYDLIMMNSSEAVLDEVHYILRLISPDFNTELVNLAFDTTVNLYNGDYPGYRACNTEYHDLRHTTNTFLAMARLVHGAVLGGESFLDRHISLSLVAALFHDAGYIQEEHDTEGTGAKYTESHVKRSMDFLKHAGAELGLSEEETSGGRAMIICSDPALDLSTIAFPSSRIELLGKALGAADLLAQMADRTYLEKLLFLYREFKEANVGGFDSEVDLLRKTVGFYDAIAQRFETTLDSTHGFVLSHFVSRWNIHSNLYQVAIENQRNYLKKILEIPNSDPRDYLKRDGIVEKVRNNDRDDD
jgi:hypothetical protein